MRCGAGLVGARVWHTEERGGPGGGGYVRRADDGDPGWADLADGAGRRRAAQGVWRGVGRVRGEGAVQACSVDLLTVAKNQISWFETQCCRGGDRGQLEKPTQAC